MGQWIQLIILAVLHGVIDMFAGMIPAVLPVIRTNYHLSLTLGGLLLSVLNFFANGVQVAAGHMREEKETSFFMRLAFPLAALVCIMYLVPPGRYALAFLVVIMIAAGTGVAVFHPESMRAIHGLDKIPSSIATPFIIMGGVFGFCGGGWLGAELVDDGVGLKGLRYMLITGGAALVIALATKFRLAVEKKEVQGSGFKGSKVEEEEVRQDNRINGILVNKQEDGSRGDAEALGLVKRKEKLDSPSGLYALRAGSADKPEDDKKTRQGDAEVKKKVEFWPLFLLGTCICTGTTTVVSLLPTHIEELGLELDFGGFSSFMFGAGMGIGGVLWGAAARKMGELRSSVTSVLAGIPILAVYLMLSGNKPAVVILLAAGFFLGGAYPMLVSMARNAEGMNLGRRMGLMVGGVWGIASLLLAAAGSIGDKTGTLPVLFGAAGFFLIGGVYGVWLIRSGFAQNAEVGMRSAEYGRKK